MCWRALFIRGFWHRVKHKPTQNKTDSNKHLLRPDPTRHAHPTDAALQPYPPGISRDDLDAEVAQGTQEVEVIAKNRASHPPPG